MSNDIPQPDLNLDIISPFMAKVHDYRLYTKCHGKPLDMSI